MKENAFKNSLAGVGVVLIAIIQAIVLALFQMSMSAFAENNNFYRTDALLWRVPMSAVFVLFTATAVVTLKRLQRNELQTKRLQYIPTSMATAHIAALVFLMVMSCSYGDMIIEALYPLMVYYVSVHVLALVFVAVIVIFTKNIPRQKLISGVLIAFFALLIGGLYLGVFKGLVDVVHIPYHPVFEYCFPVQMALWAVSAVITVAASQSNREIHQPRDSVYFTPPNLYND